jgi:hypothetical protein
MKLKILTGYVVAAALGVMFALPAFAQNVNPRAESQLQNWIARDPRLQADPGLMNNPTYLRNHPNFATWLQQHPNAHQQVEQMGAYDRNHQWRDTNWWQHNDPNWVSHNHPEWARNHPEWAEHHEERVAPREEHAEHHEAAVEHHEERTAHHEEHRDHHGDHEHDQH